MKESQSLSKNKVILEANIVIRSNLELHQS